MLYFGGMKTKLLTLFLLALASLTSAQSWNRSVYLEPVSNIDLPGIHSYAYAVHNGKWLLVGGRRDGLHPRQPFAAFPATSNNTVMTVVDPNTGEVWTQSISTLNTSIAEQLQATNMCFTQVEDTLYIAGGYAFSSTANDHITFPSLITMRVSHVIDAIINGTSPAVHILQTASQSMAVTGGHLVHWEGQFHLVGGHRFDGRYNPMGHNTYVQTYTDAIMSFNINNSGNEPALTNFSTVTDAAHLHRRDYNLVPQVFADGSYGYMISSGVFQTNIDLPYLYPVEIRSNGHAAITAFNQYLSNYHSAVAALKDTTANKSYNLFFGGMARYYYDNGTLITDDNVPFVRTISMVERDANDQLSEFALTTMMPNLEGASAEFIAADLPNLHDQVLLFDPNETDSLMIGYIVGGIASTQLNPFVGNNLSVTNASSSIFKVYLIKEPVPTLIPLRGDHTFSAKVYPNPSAGAVEADLELPANGLVFVTITDAQGKLVDQLRIRDLKEGTNRFTLLEAGKLTAGTYHLTFNFEDEFFATQNLVIAP
jgi:hypothetical protein